MYKNNQVYYTKLFSFSGPNLKELSKVSQLHVVRTSLVLTPPILIAHRREMRTQIKRN